MAGKTERKRVLVIALDGATLDLLEPWMDKGALPTLRRLFTEGASGPLTSTIPPITPTAWLSFATAKNPGQHGVFDFFSPVRSDYGELIPSSAHVPVDSTLWGILSRRDRRVILINVPMTYPPAPVNGLLISGIPTPVGSHQLSYPLDLIHDLQSRGWDLTRDAMLVYGSYADYFPYLCDLVDTRVEATRYLMKEYDWDFLMVHFLETDQVQHSYWRFMEEPGETEQAGLQTAILDVHRRVDSGIEKLLAQCDSRTTVIVMSDHGMGPTYAHVNLNNWLLHEGFMHWRQNWKTTLRRALYAIGLSPMAIYRWLPRRIVRRLTMGQVRLQLAQFDFADRSRTGKWGRWLKHLILRGPFLDYADIDWTRTLAFSTGTIQVGLIYLNVRGREPRGIVEPGEEYERVRTAIRSHLLSFADPLTGEPLVENVYFREEIYRGDLVKDAPDILAMYRCKEYDAKKGSVFFSTRIIEPVTDGNATHRMQGIVAFWSPGQISPGTRLNGAQIIDVMPTVLHLLDEPIPVTLEGRVLEDMWTESWRQAHPIRYTSEEAEERIDPGAEGLSPDEVRSVVEKLQALGYIS